MVELGAPKPYQFDLLKILFETRRQILNTVISYWIAESKERGN